MFCLVLKINVNGQISIRLSRECSEHCSVCSWTTPKKKKKNTVSFTHISESPGSVGRSPLAQSSVHGRGCIQPPKLQF